MVVCKHRLAASGLSSFDVRPSKALHGWYWSQEITAHMSGIRSSPPAANIRFSRSAQAPQRFSPEWERSMWQLFSRERMWPRSKLKQQYDVVIVGAGIH